MKNWIQKHSIVLSLLLVIAVMVMIYCFSAQTGQQSGALSGRITGWILNLIVPDYGNMPAQEQADLRQITGTIIRKLGHFSEYALLGFTLMLHIHTLHKKIRVHLPLLWAWLVGTLYAASDEFHQGFVADRGPSVFDVMIDSAGVVAGLLVMACILRRCRKKPSSDAVIVNL